MIDTFLLVLPMVIMLAAMFATTGVEHLLAAPVTSAQATLMLGQAGLALPYVVAAAIGVIALLATNGSVNIKAARLSVREGSNIAINVAIGREAFRLTGFANRVPAGQSVLSFVDPATMLGAGTDSVSGLFARRIAPSGNAAFATSVDLHLELMEWMPPPDRIAMCQSDVRQNVT